MGLQGNTDPIHCLSTLMADGRSPVRLSRCPRRRPLKDRSPGSHPPGLFFYGPADLSSPPLVQLRLVPAWVSTEARSPAVRVEANATSKCRNREKDKAPGMSLGLTRLRRACHRPSGRLDLPPPEGLGPVS